MKPKTMRTVVAGCAVLLTGGLAPAAQSAPPHGDPLLAQQWALTQLHAQAAWRVATGKGVVVAVVDTGVDERHPDLRGKVLRGFNVAPGQATSLEGTAGHGTGVAGVIAANRGNGQGIVGVAPDARILPVKIGNDLGDLNYLAPAITYAADHGAKVINLSVGAGPGTDTLLALLATEVQDAVDHAWAKGALLVAAAGNESEPQCTWPASLRHVLCVGAVDRRQVPPTFSNHDVGMQSDYLVAPGGSDSPYGGNPPGGVLADENIWTTVVPGTGTFVSAEYWAQERGTSFSAPYVSGVAAMLFQRGLTNAQVRDRLLATATDLGAPGRDPVFGYGEVDAARAVGA